MKANFSLAFLAGGLAAGFAQVAPTASIPPTTAATATEVVTLSPFQVDASRDQGYLATQTLNGTRLKTDLKDIGSALTIFTEQLLDDLAAHNINDVLMFAPKDDFGRVIGGRPLHERGGQSSRARMAPSSPATVSSPRCRTTRARPGPSAA